MLDQIAMIQVAPSGLAERLREVTRLSSMLRVPAAATIIRDVAVLSSIIDIIDRNESTDLLRKAGITKPTDADDDDLASWFRRVLAGLLLYGVQSSCSKS